jgi:hypothetical protein
MAKLSFKSGSGTSFYDTVITCSYNQLAQAIGEPQHSDNTGEDKTNFDWKCELEDGRVFTIYDWKEYRPISKEEIIEWHIGGYNHIVTEQALIELTALLANQ